MPAAVKDAYLVHIVHEYVQKNNSSSVMIFTNTCKSVPLSSLYLPTQVLTAAVQLDLGSPSSTTLRDWLGRTSPK